MKYLFFLIVSINLLQAQDTKMHLVKSGTFIPLYGVSEDKEVRVENFYMDETPVTNAQYLAFVKKNERWQKSKVTKLLADSKYLMNWESDFSFPASLSNSPVTGISWYAAKAYCESQGKRLPTTNEWEYAAMASATKPDARKDSTFNNMILSGYETPKTYAKTVGESKPNYWKIKDFYGLVWEWTYDFNAILLSGESRSNDNSDLFCGAGAIGATDLMNYAAFMRYALRNSVKANYNLVNLGCRCVKDANKTP